MNQMISKRVISAIILLILLNTGCREKDELTLPVKVYFKIGISQDNSYNSEYLVFTNCQIGIRSIQFEGKREAGGDVYFETDSKMNYQKLSFLQPTLVTVFDIPQGIYDYMKWCLTTKCLIIDDLPESSSCLGIVISGNYTYMNGSVIPFIFAIDALEQISVWASSPDGTSTIVLSVNKEYEANILLAPANAFHSISRESLEKAEVFGNDGNQIIIISSSKNKYLYEILLYRIFQNVSLIIR
jgi:hypothetical protein